MLSLWAHRVSLHPVCAWQVCNSSVRCEEKGCPGDSRSNKQGEKCVQWGTVELRGTQPSAPRLSPPVPPLRTWLKKKKRCLFIRQESARDCFHSLLYVFSY